MILISEALASSSNLSHLAKRGNKLKEIISHFLRIAINVEESSTDLFFGISWSVNHTHAVRILGLNGVQSMQVLSQF